MATKTSEIHEWVGGQKDRWKEVFLKTDLNAVHSRLLKKLLVHDLADAVLLFLRHKVFLVVLMHTSFKRP